MDKLTRETFEAQVIAAYMDGWYTHEVAKKFDISEAEVVGILEKHHCK